MTTSRRAARSRKPVPAITVAGTSWVFQLGACVEVWGSAARYLQVLEAVDPVSTDRHRVVAAWSIDGRVWSPRRLRPAPQADRSFDAAARFASIGCALADIPELRTEAELLFSRVPRSIEEQFAARIESEEAHALAEQ